MPKPAKLMRFSRRTSLIVVVLLIIVVAAVVALLHRGKTTTLIPSTNPISSSSGSTPSSAANSNNQASQNSTSPAVSQSSGPPPITPSGNFVSNHHPGGSAPTSEASTCNTTPGAVCYIEFTNGSTVKKLDAQTTNGNGAAIWYWDTKTAGLDAGSWTITVVATLNGQTKMADDVLPLVVQ